MDYLPIFLDIKKQNCLVVGGGEVATRKVSLLLKANAQVKVIALNISAKLEEWKQNKKIEVSLREYNEQDLDGVCLVIAATNNAELNQSLSMAAKKHFIPVNVVDNPSLCSFIMPSIIDRSPVIIATSTGGKSPVLARLIRGRLESLIPAGYGKLADLAAKFRDQVKAKYKDSTSRKVFWENILQSRIAEHVFSGNIATAENELSLELQKTDDSTNDQGEVYLVGGGPGDPDLLTFRALRLMQQADIVLYDRLVSEKVLELVRRDAEMIYVGKQRDHHALRQEEINQKLVDLAKQGKRVLRLKGGDPFIFGRGGEEIDTLAENGVAFQVVPGITAASGCSSYAGIPLTHRDYAQSCTFVTGHLRDGTTNLNWKMLTHPNQTIVFYMGLVSLPNICQQLIEHGMPSSMPAAIVQQGTTEYQRVFTGTLETLPSIVETEKPKPPTLIIVGKVVELQSKLAWFNPSS
ncbi:MAG: uroporphyrinogen-III C-methyltransferase [Methylococcales bacterium]|jgi:uroporphyrin-III C-methyltransferase / precorrin-2 dehydrogenase / sirohydrochlorin ferrochelatase|nr:uroporphyrinogen-III C-methyltransferase [Methylococcales bacterium]